MRAAQMNKPVLIALYLYPEASRAKALLPEALDILESYADLAPDAWGTEENEQLPYDRKELLKNAGDPAYVLLYRSKKVIKYSGYFDLGNMPFINFKFDKSTPAKKWPQIGELADRLAVVAKARYGLLNIFWPAKAPWVSDRDRLQRWLTLAAQPVPIRFSASGPTGL